MQAHDLKEPQRIHALYSENVATTIDGSVPEIVKLQGGFLPADHKGRQAG